MNQVRVEELVYKFSSKRVLVIGDLMLDEFVWGRVARISPEAPVPVVEVVRESYYPGGAANVARNVREFTPSVSVTGLVGADAHATKLRELLAENGIGLNGLQSDPTFQTIVKTRIIARQQQVVRVDRERPQPLSEQGRIETVRKIRESLPDIDAIIFEDY
jgi:D-beta-D-heptose 7-phosphate kinase/D-beta-D-heptose 1-phosphate adenosyltransferase